MVMFDEFDVCIEAAFGCDELHEIPHRADDPAGLADDFAHVVGMNGEAKDRAILTAFFCNGYLLGVIDDGLDQINERVFHFKSFSAAGVSCAPTDSQ